MSLLCLYLKGRESITHNNYTVIEIIEAWMNFLRVDHNTLVPLKWNVILLLLGIRLYTIQMIIESGYILQKLFYYFASIFLWFSYFKCFNDSARLDFQQRISCGKSYNTDQQTKVTCSNWHLYYWNGKEKKHIKWLYDGLVLSLCLSLSLSVSLYVKQVSR